MIDPRMNDLICRMEPKEECAFDQGFNFAIQRLRENEFYGHYAQFLADWLEKHFDQEVTGDKSNVK